jgi:hypothetical protein
MGAPANPLIQSLLMRAMQARMGAGGQPGGQPGNPLQPRAATAGVGTPPADLGSLIKSQSQDLRSADPRSALKMFRELKQTATDWIPRLSMRIPGAARYAAQLIKPLDGLIKELEQASQILDSVMPPNLSPAGAPTPGGGPQPTSPMVGAAGSGGGGPLA